MIVRGVRGERTSKVNLGCVEGWSYSQIETRNSTHDDIKCPFVEISAPLTAFTYHLHQRFPFKDVCCMTAQEENITIDLLDYLYSEYMRRG